MSGATVTYEVHICGQAGDSILVTGSNTLSTEAMKLRGLITLSDIGSDATHTDSTVCQDTTTHSLYAGSGTLGVCLGTSSARYKNRINPLDTGLAQIAALKPVAYYYNPDRGDHGARLQYGFLAEDVNGVLPRLTQMDAEGKPNSVDILGMVPVLVKAVQEQQAEIVALKAMVANDNKMRYRKAAN